MTTDAQATRSNNSQCRNNPRVFTPIPMSYTELLHYLIQQSLIVVVPIKPLVPPYPKNYDPNDLIDIGWLNFKENSPNINNNPLPEHGKLDVNAIIEEEDMVERVEEVRTPIRFIFEKLVQQKVIMERVSMDMYPGDCKV
ncbi:hypothetical protein CR513_18975, partial [Mucuna pruriens]